MGKEIELKYVPCGTLSKEEVFDLPYIRENAGEKRRLEMATEYLDTEDSLASSLGITLRRRLEDGKSIFYAKQSRKRSGALSERGEWSVKTDDFSSAMELLSKVGAPCDAFIGKELLTVARVSFVRYEATVNIGALSFILSYDEGSFNDKTPFSELELELLDGELAELLFIGDKIKRDLDLTDEPRSKYARALLYK